MDNKNILTKEFEGQEVGFRLNQDTGESEVQINAVAKFCGWTNISKGKEYPNWKRVNEHLKTLGCAEVHNGDFIPEYIMYPLIGRANNERATKFMLWVGQVLVEIRKHGAYISDNEENVDQDYIKFTYGQLGKTFGECSIEKLADTYNECMDWHKKNKTRISYKANSKKRKDATHTINDSKIMIMEKIVKVLENRTLMLCENNKFGLVSEINNAIKSIKDDIKKQHNTSNRSKLGAKTKEINVLKEKIDNSKVCA